MVQVKSAKNGDDVMPEHDWVNNQAKAMRSLTHFWGHKWGENESSGMNQSWEDALKG